MPKDPLGCLLAILNAQSHSLPLLSTTVVCEDVMMEERSRSSLWNV